MSATTPVALAPVRSDLARSQRRVILASSLGTLFEWYDFYLYGSLSGVISRQFFSAVNETTGFIFALLAFGAGAFVRPLGALVFGRLGDRVGRKRTFLLTIVIMGLATFLVGCLPGYAAIGVIAPITLLALRLLQGLALGGEYGGAVVYVAEHAPIDRRGRNTGWIQTTAGLGLLLSLLVMLACRWATGESFERFGWRIPFLLSVLLLAISVYIRLQLEESPVFRAMQAEGALSQAPLTEAFGRWANVRTMLLALGVSAGLAVIAFSAHLYSLLFLERILRIGARDASLVVAAAILLGTPFYVVFGGLSDRIGRKPLVVGGCLLAVLTFFPLFHGLTHYANPALQKAMAAAPVTVIAPAGECSFQFDPIGNSSFTSSCDVAKSALTQAGVPYRNEAAPPGSVAWVRIGAGDAATTLESVREKGMPQGAFKSAVDEFGRKLRQRLTEAGYPATQTPAKTNHVMLIVLCTCLISILAMTYGPLGAWLVELFPPRIRYTSLSLPYHLANGWFGAFLPAIAFASFAASGNMYSGLWYPVFIAFLAFLLGALFVPETRPRRHER
jgi:MFS family permease